MFVLPAFATFADDAEDPAALGAPLPAGLAPAKPPTLVAPPTPSVPALPCGNPFALVFTLESLPVHATN
jgi:hypothetical protein